ncbi:MAG: VIT and VWA domain-containing protein [Planctomycetota bacterium]|nr:VIT and VWA domain-containing protein [Planctomycetota bacterium]
MVQRTRSSRWPRPWLASRRTLALCLALGAAALATTSGLGGTRTAAAGGVLVPAGSEAAAWSLKRLTLEADIQGPSASVRLVHRFRNDGDTALASEFVFPVLPDAMVSDVQVRQGTQVLAGVHLRGEAARAALTADLQRRKDPALIRHLGSGAYRVSLPSLAAGASTEIELTYRQALGVDATLTEFTCPLHAVQEFVARVNVTSVAPLGPLHCPTHDVEITRGDRNHATLRYEGACCAATPRFSLFWSTTRGEVGLTLLTHWPATEDRGYFLMLAAPSLGQGERSAPQSLTFVVDASASMAGAKFEGLRAALQRIVASLAPSDLVNIIAFQDAVTPLWSAPQPATDEARAAARTFLEGLRTGGAADMASALNAALAPGATPRVVGPQGEPHDAIMLVTDGRPTAGETDPARLLAAVRAANAKSQARVFALGVGVDVDAMLLERLALESGGAPAFVRPRESVEDAVAALHARIRRPVLRNVELTAPGMAISEDMGAKLADLYAGGELAVAGRYASGGPVEVVLSGQGGTFEHEFHYTRTAARRGEGLRSDFPARVWAARRIATLVDAIRLHAADSQSVLTEIVRLSIRFGILTEYTAFLAEETCCNAAPADVHCQRVEARLVELLANATGGSGLAQAQGQAERRGAQRVGPNPGAWQSTADERDVERIEWTCVRHVGNRTFHFRGPALGWVDVLADVPEPHEASIERWSEPFFALLQNTSPEENERLAQAGPLLLEVQGTILRIVDPSR